MGDGVRKWLYEEDEPKKEQDEKKEKTSPSGSYPWKNETGRSVLR
jgi:hypothetical protein